MPSNCTREFDFNPDSMVKDVIRAFKAWARYGLPHALQQQQRQAAGSRSGGGGGGSSAGLAPNHIQRQQCMVRQHCQRASLLLAWQL